GPGGAHGGGPPRGSGSGPALGRSDGPRRPEAEGVGRQLRLHLQGGQLPGGERSHLPPVAESARRRNRRRPRNAMVPKGTRPFGTQRAPLTSSAILNLPGPAVTA